MSKEIDISGDPLARESLISKESRTEVTIRPYEDGDSRRVSDLAVANFESPSFSLMPNDVISAYKDANRRADIRAAMKDEGTEAYVAETDSGDIAGFLLLRSNNGQPARRNAYGDLDIRRLHVSPNSQGSGIGKRFFDLSKNIAADLNTAYITSHASGGSRLFFEANGWEGKTILNRMPKRGTSAIVFACLTRIVPEEIVLHPTVTHLVYAGSSESRTGYLSNLVGRNCQFVRVPGEEIEIEDALQAAKERAVLTGRNIRADGSVPVIVANSSRIDLMALDPVDRYRLENRGKPKSLDEVRENFSLMYRVAQKTGKPVPYIIRAATYLHSPRDPQHDTYSEHDVSIWLSEEGLGSLSSEEGLMQYRDELNDKFRADLGRIAAGFSLPIFLDRGYVAGINGYPLDISPKKDKVIKDSLGTALIGIDSRVVLDKLGVIQ